MRSDAQRIFAAGVAAVDPVTAVQRAVRCEGESLVVAETRYDLRRYVHFYVIGAGKAGATMAQGLETVLSNRISTGAVTIKYDHTVPVKQVVLREAGHPIPDAAGVQGAQAIMQLAQRAGAEDLVFCLLSGGGSALLPAPVPGITLAEKQKLTGALLACGASIDEINTIRKHLSQIKGGQLARHVAPATLITLVLSDVVGDRLDVIASGPTVPDPSTFQDCLDLLARYHLMAQVPASILTHLQQGQAGARPETPKSGDVTFVQGQTVIVGSNRTALLAARQMAEELGYGTLVLSAMIQGEAREVARVHAAMAQEIRASAMPLAPPVCVLSGGETTVTLKGNGKGGRNQEFALAAALDLAGLDRVVLLSAGTDGTDGPTDAAGAFADGQTVAKAQALGLQPEHYLRRNDSYNFFATLGDLLHTGPTGTNVMDMHLLLMG